MNVLAEWLTPWLSDFFLLSTVLLVAVLALYRRIAQPTRRLAIARPTLAAIFLLAGLCAMPGWSLLHLPSTSETTPQNPVYDARTQRPLMPLESALEIDRLPQATLPATNKSVSALPRSASALPWTTWLVAAYLAGSLLTLLWQASGGVLARRLIRQSPPAPPELKSLLVKIGADAKRLPDLLVSDRVEVPAALGVFRPTILFPQKMLGDKWEMLQPILAHEWAHIRHGDLQTHAATRLLMILLWPQPLWWLLRRQVRLDQETLADAAAAEVTSRTDYAEQLVAWARETASGGRRLPVASSVGLWENASQLKRRVAVLLDEKVTVLRSCSRQWRVISLIGLLSIAVGLSLVTLSPPDAVRAENPTQAGEKLEDYESAPVSSTLHFREFSNLSSN